MPPQQQRRPTAPAPAPKKLPRKVLASAALIALLGAGAAQLSVDKVAEYEGYIPYGYTCPAGVPTKCFGDTTDVVLGKEYTFEQCVDSINTHLLELARPVALCVPGLMDQPDKVRAAVVSMAYNIGPNAFCKSSVAVAMRAGDYETGCRRMAVIYTTAKGVELAGLVKRRKSESALCLEGLRGE